MKKTSIALLLVAALLASPVNSYAGDGPQELVASVMYALVVDEKCKGYEDDNPDYMKRLFSYWQSKGISNEDIRIGTLGGLRAENKYPNGAKPSISECKKAAKLKRVVIDPIAKAT